jgi:LPS export ABC transporter protein LptC
MLRISHTWTWVLLACSLIWVACENDENEVRNLGKRVLGVEDGTGIESLFSREGKVTAKLTAPKLIRYLLDTNRIEFPNSLHVDFFDDSLLIESTLDAKFARYNEYESKVLLRDSVVVINRGGDTLYTNELYWDQNQGIFFTDQPVTIHKKTGRRKGIGMRADQNFREVTIFKSGGFENVADSTM